MPAPHTTSSAPNSPVTFRPPAARGRVEFSRVDHRIYIAVTTVRYLNDFGFGREFQVAFRLDGRDGAYRVDIVTFPGAPWEAIDGGEGFTRLADAKRHVALWMRACTDERTLTPRIPNRV